jgi:ribonuclease HI
MFINIRIFRKNYRNVSKPLNPTDPATNNVAEIKAVIEALKIVKFYGTS